MEQSIIKDGRLTHLEHSNLGKKDVGTVSTESTKSNLIHFKSRTRIID